MQPVESAFNGVDIENLAQTFLSAVDTFLQSDYAIPSWQVEQTNAAGSGADNPTAYPYQYIINAKKTLGDNLVKTPTGRAHIRTHVTNAIFAFRHLSRNKQHSRSYFT